MTIGIGPVGYVAGWGGHKTWLEDAASSGVDAVKTFAAGLRQDDAAVRAALTMPWSSGMQRGKSTSSSCSNARPMVAPVSICCADACCSLHDSTQMRKSPHSGRSLTSIKLMLDELEEQAVKMRERPVSVTIRRGSQQGVSPDDGFAGYCSCARRLCGK
jgi:hypothetical protein